MLCFALPIVNYTKKLEKYAQKRQNPPFSAKKHSRHGFYRRVLPHKAFIRAAKKTHKVRAFFAG